MPIENLSSIFISILHAGGVKFADKFKYTKKNKELLLLSIGVLLHKKMSSQVAIFL